MTKVIVTNNETVLELDFNSPKSARTFIRGTLKIKSVKADCVDYNKAESTYHVAVTEHELNLTEEYLERKRERDLNSAIKNEDREKLNSFTVARLKMALRDREVFAPAVTRKGDIIEALINPPQPPEEETKANDATTDTE